MDIVGDDNTALEWSDLPYVPLIRIFNYLKVRETLNFSFVCQNFYEASQSNQVWRPLCFYDFGIEKVENEENNSYKETYKNVVLTWGHSLLPYFKRTKQIANRFNSFLQSNFETLQLRLNSSTHDSLLNELEDILSHPVPNEFKCFYKFHDGEEAQFSMRNKRDRKGVLGSYSFYNWITTMQFLSITGILALRHAYQSIFNRGWMRDFLPFSVSNKIYFIRFKRSEVIISDNDYDDDDDDDDDNDNMNNEVDNDHRNRNREKQLQSEILQILDDIPIGAVVTHYQNFSAPFKLSDSFLNFLESYVDRLEDGVFCVHNRAISLFPQNSSHFYNSDLRNDDRNERRMNYQKIPHSCTRGIHVSVSTLFISELSSLNSKYHWAYSIRIWMEKDENIHTGKYQLQSRAWYLLDGNGNESFVEGPGVIGLTPIIEPGSVFSYESCYIESTMTGMMRGHFTFVSLSNGETFNVEVPEFYFSLPLLDFGARNDIQIMRNENQNHNNNVNSDSEDEVDD